MLVTPFYKKVTKHYANRKTIGKQQKKYCFPCFIYNFYKENARNFLQLICTRSEMFQLRSQGIQRAQKFSVFSCSRYFTAFRCPKKEAEISYQCAARFKKTTELIIRFLGSLGYHLIHISFLKYKFSILDVIIVFEILQIRSSEDDAAPICKKMRSTKTDSDHLIFNLSKIGQYAVL